MGFGVDWYYCGPHNSWHNVGECIDMDKMIEKCKRRGYHTFGSDNGGRCIFCNTQGQQCGHPDCISLGSYYDENHIHFQPSTKSPALKLMEDSMAMHQAELNKAPLEDEIRQECEVLADFLVEKNRKYGNSAIEPVRIFARSDVLEQLRVRIDDKLSRVKSAQLDDDEDVINDLIGYFILYRIARKKSELQNNAV